MSFIDTTYFVGEINIPNASGEASLPQAITQYEKEILIKLLGYKLYSLLMTDLDDNGDPQTQIYKDLVNGAEFTLSYLGQNILLKWEGLVNNSLRSLIAYYVFYKWVERNVASLTSTGVSMASPGNGWQTVSPVNKMVTAWERMRELYGIIPSYHRRYFNRAVFIGDISFSIFPSVFNADPSAYNFLFANKDIYPEWIFTPEWNINAFGI
jgi:hypothetical protein